MSTKNKNEKKKNIWRGRSERQLKVISNLLSNEREVRSEGYVETTVFSKLVDAMKTFGAEQFNFFYQGFGYDNETTNSDDETTSSDDKTEGYLELSPDKPPEFVFRSILDQLAYDTSVVERAIRQRNGKPKQIKALQQADVLAFEGLVPVIGDNNLVDQETIAITYFQRVPQVLVTPYANVAMIGIPYSSIDDTDNADGENPPDLRDYLAIPHEIGHYVFWRGRWPKRRLFIVLRQLVAEAGYVSYLHWLEEIFADVYGCLVAGPVVALSIQDLMFDNLPARFVDDDGEHPAPVVRPYIYTRVLERKGEDTSTKVLHFRWDNKLKLRGNPDFYYLRPNGQDEMLQIVDKSTGIKDINEIVDIIFDILTSGRNFPADWGGNIEGGLSADWDKNVQEREQVLKGAEALYDVFTSNVRAEDNNSLPLKKFTEYDKLPERYKSEPFFSKPNSLNSWAIKLREIAKPSNDPNKVDDGVQVQAPLPASVWQVVLDADGWGPGGGESDGAGKDVE